MRLTEVFGRTRTVLSNMRKTLVFVYASDPRSLVLSFALNITTALIPIASSWLTAMFINTLFSGTVHSLLDPRLFWIVAGYVTLPLIDAQLRFYYTHVAGQLRLSFEQYRDLQLMRKMAGIDIQTHEDSAFNNLSIRARENQYRLMNFMDALVTVSTTLTAAAVSAALLAAHHPWLTLILLVALVPQLIVQVYFGKRAWGIWSAKSELRRRYHEYQGVFFNLPALIETRIFRTRDHFLRLVDGLLSVFNNEVRSNERRRFAYQGVATTVTYVAVGGCVLFLMNQAVAGALAAGTFLFLAGRINEVRRETNQLIWTIRNLTTDSPFITDFFDLMGTKRVLVDGAHLFQGGAPCLECSNLTFAYPKSESTVLRNLSFSIAPGEKVAIVGVNGAGKTTLTKLLMRFYDPTEGSITIDGEPLASFKLSSWHSRIGYLPQNYRSYHMPVKETIALGDPTAPLDMVRVKEAARKAGADTFIEAWPKGYESELSKRFDGEEPSVGQWQKLALARLFYKDPDIWILDEPTSSIDAVAELDIFNQLENLPDTKTVILISHRFNTVKNADKILVIEHGELKEMGTHNELMQQGGTYHRLFTAQKGSYDAVPALS